jgi:hypothetical protein
MGHPLSSYTGRSKRAHGAMNKERHVCARRRDGEAAGPVRLVGDKTCYFPTFTSRSFVYTDPADFNSLFISTTDSIASELNDSGQSSAPVLSNPTPTCRSPTLIRAKVR